MFHFDFSPGVPRHNEGKKNHWQTSIVFTSEEKKLPTVSISFAILICTLVEEFFYTCTVLCSSLLLTEPIESEHGNGERANRLDD